MTTTHVPLDKLELSPFNVRQSPAEPEDHDRLVASIKAHGLINPLTVTNGGDSYAVVAGGRRLAALRQLFAEDGGDPPDIPVKLISEEEAHQISLAENYVRSAMSNIEIYEAVQSIGLEDTSAKVLAERFGLPMDRARRVARLANLHPTIFAAWKAGAIKEDQAAAYAATADHDKQLAVFERLADKPSWESGSGTIRREMGFVDYDHARLLREVGRDRYLEAGGTIETDLFSDNEKVCDPDLLIQLVNDKRTADAEAVAKRCNRDVVILTDRPESPADHIYGWQISYAWPDQDTETKHDEILKAIDVFDSDQFDSDEASHEAYEKLEQELEKIEDCQLIILPEGGTIGLLVERGNENFYWLECPADDKQDTPAQHDDTAGDSIGLSQRASLYLAAERRRRLIERSASSKKMAEQSLSMMIFTVARRCFMGPISYEIAGLSTVASATDTWRGESWFNETDHAKAFAAFKNAYNTKAKLEKLTAEILASLTDPKIAGDKAPHIDWLASVSEPVSWVPDEEFWNLWRKGQMLELVREFDPEQEIVTRISGVTQAEMRRLLHSLFTDPEAKAWKGISQETRNAVASWVPEWLRFADETGEA